jgi:hypothetical protein
MVHWSHLDEWVKQQTADLQGLRSEVLEEPPFSALTHLGDAIEDRFSHSPTSHRRGRHEWLNQLGAELCRVQLSDDGDTDRVRALASKLADTTWLVTSKLELVPYIGGVAVGAPRRADVKWQERVLYTEDKPLAKLAHAVGRELGDAFGLPPVAEAIKVCFDRPPDWVTEYIEENFALLPKPRAEPPREPPAPSGTNGAASAVRSDARPARVGAGPVRDELQRPRASNPAESRPESIEFAPKTESAADMLRSYAREREQDADVALPEPDDVGADRFVVISDTAPIQGGTDRGQVSPPEHKVRPPDASARSARRGQSVQRAVLSVEQRGLELYLRVLEGDGIDASDQRASSRVGADLVGSDGVYRELKTFSGRAPDSIGLSKYEHERALEEGDRYELVIVENVWDDQPRLTMIRDPLKTLDWHPTGEVAVRDWRAAANAGRLRQVVMAPSADPDESGVGTEEE